MDTWRRAREGDHAYVRQVIGERRAVQAFLGAKPISRGSIEVELRESPPTSDPRSGRPLFVPPVVVLWIEERPVAVRVRSVVAISRFPPEPRLVSIAGGGLPGRRARGGADARGRFVAAVRAPAAASFGALATFGQRRALRGRGLDVLAAYTAVNPTSPPRITTPSPLPFARGRQPHVEVVVVLHQRLDPPWRTS